MLIDGHGIAFRAFYAVPMLNAPDGTPTNVIMGFMNMLERLERVEAQPESTITVVFDAPCKTFRHEAFPEYKQQRKPTPPEFKPQIPILIELLKLLGYPVLMIDGVEADDTIATASRLCDATVVSSDKDLLQILRPGVKILRPAKGVSTFNRYDEEIFRLEYGFEPCYMPDYLALLGDVADNIPGVPGIGEKTALALIAEYKSLENLVENIDKLKPSHKKNLGENREQAFVSRELNRLKFDVPLDADMFAPSEPDYKAAYSLAERLGLRQICNRIRILEIKSPPPGGGCPEGGGSLFT